MKHTCMCSSSCILLLRNFLFAAAVAKVVLIVPLACIVSESVSHQWLLCQIVTTQCSLTLVGECPGIAMHVSQQRAIIRFQRRAPSLSANPSSCPVFQPPSLPTHTHTHKYTHTHTHTWKILSVCICFWYLLVMIVSLLMGLEDPLCLDHISLSWSESLSTHCSAKQTKLK